MGMKGSAYDLRFNIYAWIAKCSLCEWRHEYFAQSYLTAVEFVEHDHPCHQFQVDIRKDRLAHLGSGHIKKEEKK